MLVISRKKGEVIRIGNNIEITVAKIEDGVVKLAITAPKDIVILRKELYTQIEEVNKSSIEYDINLIKNLMDK